MGFYRACDIADEIAEQYRRERKIKPWEAKAWTLLDFPGRRSFDASASATTPENFISIVDTILSREDFLPLDDFKHKAVTERGEKPITVYTAYHRVKEWLEREAEVTFSNLYYVFLVKYQSPSGILCVGRYAYLIFMPGLTDYNDTLWIGFTSVSPEEKRRIRELSRLHGLKFWGEPSQPVLYRRVEPPIDAEACEKFVQDVIKFFEDAGYPEV